MIMFKHQAINEKTVKVNLYITNEKKNNLYIFKPHKKLLNTIHTTLSPDTNALNAIYTLLQHTNIHEIALLIKMKV